MRPGLLVAIEPKLVDVGTKSRVESTQLTEKSHQETDKTDRVDDS